MKKVILILCSVHILVACSSKKERINVKEDISVQIKHNITDTIRISTVPKGGSITCLTSWNMNNPEPLGSEVSFIKKMLDDLHINYEFVEKFSKPSEEEGVHWSIYPLTNDEADISIAHLTITDERKLLTNFSLPYTYDKATLLIHKDSEIKSIFELENKKVLCGSTSPSYAWITENIPNANIITEHDLVFDPEYLLLNRLIDCYSGSLEELKCLFEANKEHLSLFDEYFFQEPIGIAISKNRPELLKIINQYLELTMHN